MVIAWMASPAFVSRKGQNEEPNSKERLVSSMGCAYANEEWDVIVSKCMMMKAYGYRELSRTRRKSAMTTKQNRCSYVYI